MWGSDQTGSTPTVDSQEKSQTKLAGTPAEASSSSHKARREKASAADVEAAKLVGESFTARTGYTNYTPPASRMILASAEIAKCVLVTARTIW